MNGATKLQQSYHCIIASSQRNDVLFMHESFLIKKKKMKKESNEDASNVVDYLAHW